MTDFRVLLDELGIETASAWCMGCQVRVFPPKGKANKYNAVSVVPLSTDSTVSGAIKGAAWGVFIAGGLGAAVGSMVGGGMKVAFELHTEEGEVLRCIAGKNAYLDIKKQVETKAAKANRVEPSGPRAISTRLLIGTAILPIPLGLGFWRRGYTGRARALAAVWTVLWCVGLTKLPQPPEGPAAVEAGQTKTVGDVDKMGDEVEALASSIDTPNAEKMNDRVQQQLWVARTEEAVRSQMRNPDTVRFRRSYFKIFQGQLPMVCGEVSAENGFGGRSGYQRYIAAGETFGPVLEEMMAPGEFAQTWNQICV